MVDVSSMLFDEAFMVWLFILSGVLTLLFAGGVLFMNKGVV